MAAHSGADNRHLADPLVGLQALRDVQPAQCLRCRGEVVGVDRERQVGLLIGRRGLVLDDHVDVHVRLGEGPEDAARDARLI
jgi:hypothetical protein